MSRPSTFIRGKWKTSSGKRFSVINPATEEAIVELSESTIAEVAEAVDAASEAFATFSRTTVDDRIALLKKIISVWTGRMGDLCQAISQEMGAPFEKVSKTQQGPAGLGYFKGALQLLQDGFDFQSQLNDTTFIRKEPIGVCAFVTPWNWPANQIGAKVAPALAAGCTIVLKPSELAPISSIVIAEILEQAGVPIGVFNMVQGDLNVGRALVSDPRVLMISFTGSTRAGREVTKASSNRIARVTLELGGKSPNIVLPGMSEDSFKNAVTRGTYHCFHNTGQSCNAPTRMLVPKDIIKKAGKIAAHVAASLKVGDPFDESTRMGPLANRKQFDKVQQLITVGIEEGATLVAGGTGRPKTPGFFVKPTVFIGNNTMRIAREEIFGPVLTIIPYSSIEEAIEIANDTDYGLSSYVQSDDDDLAFRVASKIRAGNCHINGTARSRNSPFGGYKQSGNGREGGAFGLEEFLEVKAIFQSKKE